VIVHDYGLTDHSLILCNLLITLTEKNEVNSRRNVRNWKNCDFERLRNDISASIICDINVLSKVTSVSDLVELYNETVVQLLDKNAPFKTVTNSTRKTVPWFYDELKRAIQHRRRLERLWRKSRCAAHRVAFVLQRNLVKKLVVNKKRQHYERSVGNVSSTRELWCVLNVLVKGYQSHILPNYVSDEIGANSFAKKVLP